MVDSEDRTNNRYAKDFEAFSGTRMKRITDNYIE